MEEILTALDSDVLVILSICDFSSPDPEAEEEALGLFDDFGLSEVTSKLNIFWKVACIILVCCVLFGFDSAFICGSLIVVAF